jgi:alkylhydroperoxidase family enzyme
MRLPYVSDPPQAKTPEEDAIVSRIRARRAPKPLLELDLALLHSPPVADGWNTFLSAIRTGTTLGAAVREICMCRVAVLNQAWYEWAHHAPLAQAAGLSDEAMDTLKGKGWGGLTKEQMAVVDYTDAMTKSVSVPQAIFDELKAFFTDQEVVEITATVAAYNCVSRFLVALDVGEKNGSEEILSSRISSIPNVSSSSPSTPPPGINTTAVSKEQVKRMERYVSQVEEGLSGIKGMLARLKESGAGTGV